MWRILKFYHSFRRGPFSPAVTGMAIGSIFVAGLLLASLIYRPLWALAIAISLVGIYVGLLLIVVLLNRQRAKLNDTDYALSLMAGLQRTGWELTNFFTDGSAANASLQLLNLKVLLFFRPARVLELGSGQTTKLLSSYARANPSAYVLTLEQDETWVAHLKGDVSHDYRYVPLEKREFSCNGTGFHLVTRWYQDIPELHQHPFNYVLVDGPQLGTHGNTKYSRCGILQYMPSILADSFVIVFDDAERYGEMATARALGDILNACGVRFLRFSLHGIKTQVIFCSPDLSYLQSI